MEKSKVIVDEMYESDKFSQWLGIEIVEIKQGYCKLKMKVREEMTNGFGIAHGGICFSIADTALAFAANSHNIKSLSIETSISLIKKVKADDIIFIFDTSCYLIPKIIKKSCVPWIAFFVSVISDPIYTQTITHIFNCSSP